jgi:hypothetical protein
VLAVLVVTVAHLALTAVALLASLYFLIPGEPGFDPGAAERAAFFGRALEVLAFPLLPMLTMSVLRPLTAGLLGWFWLGVNSVLWAVAIVWTWRYLAKRLARARPPGLDAA